MVERTADNSEVRDSKPCWEFITYTHKEVCHGHQTNHQKGGSTGPCMDRGDRVARDRSTGERRLAGVRAQPRRGDAGCACGIGATVGSVIPTHKAIIPAAVGVDIGCGMVAAQLSLLADRLPGNLGLLRSAIEARVPVGFAKHDARDIREQGVKRWRLVMSSCWKSIRSLRRGSVISVTWAKQVGTLGGGNHFIELCLTKPIVYW